MVALKPDMYIDCGTVGNDDIASLEAVQRRTGVPCVILNGALRRIPETYPRLGSALGVAERGERLGLAAERLMTKYRGVLKSGSGPARVTWAVPVTDTCHVWKTQAAASNCNGSAESM